MVGQRRGSSLAGRDAKRSVMESCIKNNVNNLRLRYIKAVKTALRRTSFDFVDQYCAEVFMKSDSPSPSTATSNFAGRNPIEEKSFTTSRLLYVTKLSRRMFCTILGMRAFLVNDVANLSEHI